MEKKDILRLYPKDVTLRGGQKVTIRLMTAADEEALLEFFRSLPEKDRLFLKEDMTDPQVIHRWVKNLDYNRVIPLLAFSGERIVADAPLLMNTHGWSRHVGEFRLVVSSDFRRLGLGLILSKELFFLALSLKLEKLMAETVEEHVAIIRILKSLGFETEAVLKDHVKDIHGNPHNLLIMTHDVKSVWKRMEDVIRDSFADLSG